MDSAGSASTAWRIHERDFKVGRRVVTKRSNWQAWSAAMLAAKSVVVL